jgi:starch phosphorylase
MIDDYVAKFYTKLSTRSALLKANDFAKAKEIATWKEKVAKGWDNIEVVSVDVPEKMIHNPQVGEVYDINIIIDTKAINDKGLGIELVATNIDKNNVDSLYSVEELKIMKTEGTKLYFNLEKRLNMAGTFKYGFRMFPKNEDLPHRQDFCFVRWI